MKGSDNFVSDALTHPDPFRFISWRDKYLETGTDDHADTVSRAWLKAAFLDFDYRTGDSFTKSPVSASDALR